jgi:hypothetical protein
MNRSAVREIVEAPHRASTFAIVTFPGEPWTLEAPLSEYLRRSVQRFAIWFVDSRTDADAESLRLT